MALRHLIVDVKTAPPRVLALAIGAPTSMPCLGAMVKLERTVHAEYTNHGRVRLPRPRLWALRWEGLGLMRGSARAALPLYNPSSGESSSLLLHLSSPDRP